MSQPFFHEESSTVRFWVQVDSQLVGASVGRNALHFRYRPHVQGEDPLETYKAFADDIGDAVRRRVAQGAIEPVMLREFDLRPIGA
jgi:hypothetical protein